jgi:hypothetical protein
LNILSSRVVAAVAAMLPVAGAVLAVSAPEQVFPSPQEQIIRLQLVAAEMAAHQ